MLPVPAPATVMISMWAWIISCVVPLLAIVYALTRLDDVRSHLRASAMAQSPTSSPESIERVVGLTIVIALVAQGLPIVLQLIFALVMVNRRGWARVMLVIVALFAVPAAAIAFGALSDQTAATINNLTIWISILSLMVLIGIFTMYWPSSNYWFRTRRRR